MSEHKITNELTIAIRKADRRFETDKAAGTKTYAEYLRSELRGRGLSFATPDGASQMSTALGMAAKVESIVEFRDKLKALRNCHFPAWEMERVAEFVAFAIGKLSPLQVDDVAVLVETPEITVEKSHGWLGSKHTLVAGRRGWIRSVDWVEGKFSYLWEPEAQTWISSFDGAEKPVDRPAQFSFGERWLAKEQSK